VDKRAAYEESIRVPLAVRYPAWFAGGERSDRMVLNIDIPATIIHAVTGQAESFPKRFLDFGPDGFDRSLKLSAEGAGRASFLYEYFQESKFPVTPTMRAVRTSEFKYVTYDDPDQTDELYDLRGDPHETVNLIASEPHREVLAELMDELRDLRIRTGDR
jgi:N-acetylglucosamine-6-sulfatase